MTALHALPPYLTDAEIDDMCAPLKVGAAKRKRLEKMGMLVKTKPNGRPLVARSEFERVLGAARMAPGQSDALAGLVGPNAAALREHISRRKHGPRT